MMTRPCALVLLFYVFFVASLFGSATQFCEWEDSAGNKFDLRPLVVPKNSDRQCMRIIDGDIPCTPEVEKNYGYVWNFCNDVNRASLPAQCSSQGKSGVVLQFGPSDIDGICWIVAHYDSDVHTLSYSLMDAHDPSKGVSVAYPPGETCHTNDQPRSATVDVMCANTPAMVVTAQEPETCNYHMIMKSYYGCPASCAITKNGLCDSHGHCATDQHSGKAYCFCNEGYYGNDCSSTNSKDAYNAPASNYDGYSLQVTFLVILLLVALTLTGLLFYMGYKIMEFRKEQVDSYYNQLAGGENEMVETLDFSS